MDMNPRVQYLQYKANGYNLLQLTIISEQIRAKGLTFGKQEKETIQGRLDALKDTMVIVNGILEGIVAEIEIERVRKRGFFEKLFSRDCSIGDWGKAQHEFLADVHERLIGLKTIAAGNPGYTATLEAMLKATNVRVN